MGQQVKVNEYEYDSSDEEVSSVQMYPVLCLIISHQNSV